MGLQKNEIMEEEFKEMLYKEADREGKTWMDFYFEFHNLIERDRIFYKLPHRLKYILVLREYRKSSLHFLNFLKNLFLIPVLLFWRIFLIKFERSYYKTKYPKAHRLENIKEEDFEFLFVLNTRDHVITALPILEKMNERGKKILIVTFREVYFRYTEDFNKLGNAKILFLEYELKNFPIKKYIEILYETKNKFETLKSHKMAAGIKKVIQTESSFVNLHLKEELIQYYFFKEIFDSFNLKGAISIAFTTAFEIAKEKDMPTFILQHGVGVGGWPFMSDYMILSNDLSKLIFTKRLDNTVKALSLGSPRFEYLSKVVSSKRNVSDFNKKIGCQEYIKNVTYISVWSAMFENKKLLLALKELRKKMPKDINFIIKLHPREVLRIINFKKEIKKIFSHSELEKTTFIKKGMDFHEILANSDVVISTASTGITESIAMDIPLIQVNFTRRPYDIFYDLSSFGWREPINEPKVLIDEVLSILSDKKRYAEVIKKQRWLKLNNRLFKNFGNCDKVIAETIMYICDEKRKMRDE